MATVTLLQLKSDFWRHQNQHWQGTATGGSTTRLTDTTLTDFVSETFPTQTQLKQIRMTSGASSGDLRQVANIDMIRGDVMPSRPFSNAVANGDTYELWGQGLYGGQTLTNFFNDTLRRLRPITFDQLTIVTSQRIYDITSLVVFKDDVKEVWVRLIDPANLIPYTPIPVQRWNCFEYKNADPAGNSQVVIEIIPALTNTTVVQLWLEHQTSFTPFTADTDTQDSIYRDWIAWEAVLTYARRQRENVSTDRKLWDARVERALTELKTLRQRFIPLRPIRIQIDRFV